MGVDISLTSFFGWIFTFDNLKANADLIIKGSSYGGGYEYLYECTPSSSVVADIQEYGLWNFQLGDVTFTLQYIPSSGLSAVCVSLDTNDAVTEVDASTSRITTIVPFGMLKKFTKITKHEDYPELLSIIKQLGPQNIEPSFFTSAQLV